MTILDLGALEWRRIRRDAVLWAALLFGVLALGFGLSNGLAWRKFQERAIERAGSIGAARIAEAKTKAAELNANPAEEVDFWIDPRSGIGFEGAYLRLHDCLAPAPLAALAVGQSDLLPYCVRVAVGPWPAFLPSYEWENPLRLLLGRFDCAYVIIYLLPLLALLASFNLLSREREQGTLPLLLSCPVPLRLWLGVGSLLRAAIILGGAAAAVVVGLFLAGFDPGASGAALHLGLWLALVVAYGGFWFALAFLVNACRLRSETNALILVSAWLALVIIVPAGLNLALKQLYPAPSRVEFLDSLRRATAESEQRGGALLQKYLQDHPDLAPGDKAENQNGFVTTLLAVNAETSRLLEPEKQRFREQNERQLAAIEWLRFASPALLFQHEANALSGNDQARRLRYLDSVEGHRNAVKSFLDPHFASDEHFDGYDDIPAFAYQDIPATKLARHAAVGLLQLAALDIALCAAGWVLLSRPELD
ncbi:DUF3526 domain-containing protein [Methylocapsa palsarum]|uniref:ABC-2 type transport system permease protein n=1 Tax=Methylocapsa palsarum TaxID=1612308 RepID=A0A1I4AQM9_9HYPH|nr:DUF3526 domain-containing protein [Methylocapsa palsarum]SFK58201.1 ABC-2 type transport system permease protein [Methylocapsa palsarum]